MSGDALLVLNAGSSSIKLSLYLVTDQALALAWHGELEGLGSSNRPHFHARDASGAAICDEHLSEGLASPVGWVLDWIEHHLASARLVGCGHRVVHGGADFAAPVRIDAKILEALARFVPLAPLHQPANLAPIQAILAARPGLPQVACFDTAFHRGHSDTVDAYALPLRYYEAGVRRYGFHGLSYEYIARQLPTVSPALAKGRVVVAHLGSGASLCALDAGRSVDTTMGFTALDGLPMGTRTGQIDPGVLLFLMEHDGLSLAQLTDLLYRESGLKGLSGISNDMRTLLATDAPAAKRAIAVFCHQIAKQAAGLAATLGGLDGLVFTAGIGEHQPEIRVDVLRRLAWLGFALDEAANARGGPCLTTPESRAQAYVIATDEERMIAEHTAAILGIVHGDVARG